MATIKLDSLKIKRLALIKIDVEGAEVEVIRGAEKTIIELQHWIIFEVEVPIRANEGNPISLLSSHGYTFFDVNTLESVNYELLKMRPGVFNLLAVPSSKSFSVDKSLIQALNLGESFNARKGDYLFDIKLGGKLDCLQGIGIWNLDDSNWEIYYETRLSSLMHTTNSCLPIYLELDSRLQIRTGIECSHNHFLSSNIFSLKLSTV